MKLKFSPIILSSLLCLLPTQARAEAETVAASPEIAASPEVKEAKKPESKARPATRTRQAPAASAYRWTDAEGHEYFGSKPPADARNLKPLSGRSYSRYSSERMIKAYSAYSNKTYSDSKLSGEGTLAVDTPTLAPQASSSSPGSSTKPRIKERSLELTAARAKLEEETQIPPSNAQISGLEQSKLLLKHDDKFRVLSCSVVVHNTSSIPAANLILSFEFPDGTLVPGVGPETLDPGQSATYQVPADMLPLLINNAKNASDATPKVELRLGS